VRELNLAVANALRQTFGTIDVSGEISEWKAHRPSGHCYFTLVDRRSVLRCVLYRDDAQHLAFEPKPGLAVVARGRLTIYPEQGSYQLVASRLVPSGAGAAQAAFEALKKKLQAEGLFDPVRKRELPRFPAVVGVVTSASGAVAFDIVRILRARWPAVEILFAPVLVQGPEAPVSIVNGIRKQASHGRAEVLIVGRGGGSADDLAAFNDERVVRAIASSPIPVVSAVGHETDVTLSDLAADVRAATPSRAAELAVPDAREWCRTVDALGDRLRGAVSRELLQTRRILQHLSRGRGFYEPQLALEGAMSRVDSMREALIAEANRLVPARSLAVRGHEANLARAARETIAARRPRLAHAAGKLAALDPSSVLGRGYALCATEDGSLVRDGASLHEGQAVRLRFMRGGARAEIREAWAEREETR